MESKNEIIRDVPKAITQVNEPHSNLISPGIFPIIIPILSRTIREPPISRKSNPRMINILAMYKVETILL